jgi:hypothetical protein
LHFAKILEHLKPWLFKNLIAWKVFEFFGHPKFQQCCLVNNWEDNCLNNNLTKTPQTFYFTHHIVVIIINLWATHLQPCIITWLQKCPTGKTLHQHNLEIAKNNVFFWFLKIWQVILVFWNFWYHKIVGGGGVEVPSY